MKQPNLIFYGIDSRDALPVNHRPQYDLLAKEVLRRYGNMVNLKFVNTLGEEMSKLYQNWFFFSLDKLPLVMLNERPICYGKVQREKIFHELNNMLRPGWPWFR